MLRRGAVVALATFLLVLVAVVRIPAAQAQQEPLRAINAMLATRAKAQLAHDRDGFAATIDPKAPAAFRDSQLKSYDGLASLPLKSLSFQARTDLIGDITRAVDRNLYAGAHVSLPQTIRFIQFPLDDTNSRQLDDMWWTYVERDGKWYVGGDRDAVDLGLEPNVSMWDTAPVIVVQSAHVMLIAHPEARARAEALLATTEAALGVVAQRWILPWSGKLTGFVPGSPDELTDLLQATVDVTKFVAFVSYAFDPDSLAGTAPRLYVQDTNLSQYSQAGQTETLVHELTHAAGSFYAGAYTPSWVHEGLADWVAGDPNTPVPRGSGAGKVAPRDDQFGAGSQGSIVQAYRDSRSLIAALGRVAGHDAPFQFFKTLGATKVRPGGRDYIVDDSLSKVGVPNLVDLEAHWVSGK